MLGGRASDVAATYERFGPGGLVRLATPFAAAILDRSLHRLVLARSPTFGAEPAIFWRDGPFRFSTDPWALAGELDAGAIRAWLASGLWPSPERTAFAGVSVVPHGAYLSLSRFERKVERYWTFVPHPSPRPVPFEEARRGLVRDVQAHRGRTYDEAAIDAACRSIAYPAALSEIAEVASIVGSRVEKSDLGMREILGGTEGAIRAYVQAIAGVLDGSPSLGTLARIVRASLAADLALERPVLWSEIGSIGWSVLARWGRHVPGVPESMGVPGSGGGPSFSGDRFADRRFLETIDPVLIARRRALAEAGIDAPYLSRAIVELAFTLPREHFVAGREMMRLAGGRPIRFVRLRNPSYAEDHPYRALPRRDFGDLERTAHLDRWLGLGAFLRSASRRTSPPGSA